MMKKCFQTPCLLILILAAALAGQARGARLASAIPGIASSSTYENLDGTWQFRFDPADAGDAGRWFAPDAPGDWGTLAVPGNFNTYEIGAPQAAGLDKLPKSYGPKYLLGRSAENETTHNQAWYLGRGWYRRTFDLQTAAKAGSERLVLHFLGVPIRARVWVNGQLAARHLFPYTGFDVDITPMVRAGRNLLVVEADNRLLDQAIPDKKGGGWWPFGGITRDVILERRPATALTRLRMDTKIKPGQPGTWEWTVAITVENAAAPQTAADLEIKLTDPKTGAVLASRIQPVTLAAGKQELSLKGELAKATAWTPEHPTLYNLSATIKAATEHELAIRTAFRDIRTSGSRILLNGKPLQIRGFSRHEEYLDYGSSVPRERTRQDLEDLKALGCNFIRTAHYPQEPYVYTLCDELGLLAWAEIPAWQTDAKTLTSRQVFEEYARPQILEMIDQNRHHPSIMVWSVGNEYDSGNKDVREKYTAPAIAVVHAADPTRLASFASDKREKDASFDLVDVIGINEYYGWYYGSRYDIAPVIDKLHKAFPAKPILVTEFGAGAAPGYHSKWGFELAPMVKRGSVQPHSEEWQAAFLQSHLEQIFTPARRDYVVGGVLWVYADFRNPNKRGLDARSPKVAPKAGLAKVSLKQTDNGNPGHPPEWANYNIKGVVGPDRQPKAAYALVKAFFARLAAEQQD